MTHECVIKKRRGAMLTTIVNCTPHELNIRRQDGSFVQIAPSGTVARVESRREFAMSRNGIAISRTRFGKVTGLPEPSGDTWFVVSLLCKQAARNQGRDDVLSPGELIRDEQGRPIGCDGLTL